MKEFTVNNSRLKYTVIFPENLRDKNPAILFLHGLTGKKESSYQYAQGLAKIGYISFLFDMRGHGESEGNLDILSLNDFLNDAISAYDQLVSIESVDADNISIIGSSMGGYLALRLSTKRNVKNIVLRAPADYPDEIITEPAIDNGADNPNTLNWRKETKTKDGSLALQAIYDFKGLIHLLESELDDRVPHTTVQNYIDAIQDKNKLTYQILKGAPHSIKEGPFRDTVETIMVDWFSNERDP